MKKTKLYGYVYDFLFDFDSIDVDDILDIPKYLMEKTRYKKNVFIYLQMFIGLLRAFTTGSFGEPLAFNREGRIKCVSFNTR